MWWHSLIQYTQTDETNTRMHKDTHVLPRMGRWLSSTMAGSEESSTNETVLLFRIHRLPHAVKQPQCVTYTQLSRPLSLSLVSAMAAPMTPSPLTRLIIKSEGWISARTRAPTPENDTKTKHTKLKVHHFLPLAQSESWEAQLALTMTARGGKMGEEACEVTDLSEDICGLYWEATLCNHRRVTEGRAEWFLPACVLTKVAESKFTESAPLLFWSPAQPITCFS